MDATITKYPLNGPPKSLSMKCADTNQLVLQTLGVSKAILNYVIFCHQEDSNWPLEEGSKVKQKFDEIFASTKYNGALKAIKDVRTAQMEEVKLGKKDAEFYDENRKDARQKRKHLQTKETNKREIERDLAAITEEIEPLRTQLKDLNEVEQNFSGIRASLTEAQTNIDHYRKEIQVKARKKTR